MAQNRLKQPFPNVGFPAVDSSNGVMTSTFHQFLFNLWQFAEGLSPGNAAQVQTLASSPFIFGPTPESGVLVVNGTASIFVSRDGGSTYLLIGQSGGIIPVRFGDFAKVEWSGGAPDVTYLPN